MPQGRVRVRTHRVTQFVLLSLAIALAAPSQARSDTHPSSVPGIDVADGFDAEIVSEGLWLPLGIALDIDRNIVLGSNCEMCPALRLSPEGALLGESDWILDPDGVGVDSLGRVFVVGDQSVTLVNSFAASPDLILAGGFSNLNDVAVSPSGELFVYDSNGEIWRVSATGVVDPAPFVTTAMGAGIGLDPLTGGLLVTTGTPSDLVLAIAPDGTVTQIASMPAFSNPADAEQGVGAFGDSIYVTLASLGEIVTVDRASGSTTLFASGFDTPMRMVFEGDAGVLVSDMNAGRIIRIFPLVLPGPEPMIVRIKIKADDGLGCFNPNGHGVLPVVIYGSADLDVRSIDFMSLDLEGLTVKSKSHSRRLMVDFKYVNQDRFRDAVVKFEDDGHWTGTAPTATMTGMLDDETPIEGSDSICIVQPGHGCRNDKGK